VIFLQTRAFLTGGDMELSGKIGNFVARVTIVRVDIFRVIVKHGRILRMWGIGRTGTD